MSAARVRIARLILLGNLLPLGCATAPASPTTGPSAAAATRPAPNPVPMATPVVQPSPTPTPPLTAPPAMISTLAGNGASGFEGDGSAATGAKLNAPWGVAYDAGGDLWFADSGNSRLRRVNKEGTITSMVGLVSGNVTGDNLTDQTVTLSQARSLAFTPAGALFIADTYANRIRRIDPTTRRATVIAGNGGNGWHGDGGIGTQATLSNPTGIAVDASETVYIADTANQAVRRISSSGIITTIVGAGVLNNSTANSLRYPEAVALDKSGALYIADGGNCRICRWQPDGSVTTVVGTGVPGFAGDGGPATAARINHPLGLAVAADGTLYFADANNRRIRMVRPDGIILTVAGSEVTGSTGDGGPALSAGFGRPTGLTLDPAGNLIVSDSGSGVYDQRIRKITFTK